MRKQLFTFCILIALVSCSTTNGGQNMEEKNEVMALLKKSNQWYINTKENWSSERSVSEENIDWNIKVYESANNSKYFSKTFLFKMQQRIDSNFTNKFGVHFFPNKDLGRMLKGFCNADSTMLKKEITKISDTSYRYTTKFYNVLNDVPIPDQVEGFDWLWDKGENGEIWQFSILIIKENDKWVIDEIDKYMAVPIETED